ncbi:MAG: hypothetical protein ACI36V_08140 [Coriobacteriales bacterium]
MTAIVRSSNTLLSRLKRLAGIAIVAFAAAVLTAGAAAIPAMAATTAVPNASTYTATITAKTDSLSFSKYISRPSSISYAMVDTTRSEKLVFVNDTDYYVEVNGVAKVLAGTVGNIQYRTNVNNSSMDKVLPAEAIGTQTTLFKYVPLAPGEQISCYAEDIAFGSNGKVVIQMHYKTNKAKPVTIQGKPDLRVTKLSNNEVAIRVKLANNKADVSGVTKIDVLANGKTIKSFKSKSGAVKLDADGYYKFRYAKTNAGTAKYSAVATTIAKPSDTATSASVKPAANKATLKVSKKISDYRTAATVISSLSYSGGKLVVKGYTVNPYGMTVPNMARTVNISHNTFSQQYEDRKMMSFAKGFKSFTLKIKTKKVIDLRDNQDYLVDNKPPVFA